MVRVHPKGAVDTLGEKHMAKFVLLCAGEAGGFIALSAPSWFLTYVSNVSSDYFS